MSEEITTEENKVSEDLESQNAEKLAKNSG